MRNYDTSAPRSQPAINELLKSRKLLPAEAVVKTEEAFPSAFMSFTGISDSVASILAPAGECSRCHTAARIGGGACLTCLLRTATEPLEPVDPAEFDALLSQIDIRDSDWRLGNYQVLEEIGRGGMGVIYRARQRHSKRIVALKRVLSYHGDSRETLERFRREAEAAASLDHPNILPIYEVGEADGLPFFTMKYAAGGTLQQAAPALRANPRECVRLIVKVSRAVAYAHREGILHRDLKPGNILLDARGEPMVSDFGLAKWIDASSDLTRSLAIFGTPGFIAPEQAQGERAALTPAADVYSLGAILFDLLTGRPPFLGEHALAVIRQAGEKAAPKLRSLNPSLDRDLETVCAKCLEREPQARYSSAADLAEDLARWLEGRPILARPVFAPTKAWRWTRRNPLLAGATAACVLIAGLAVARQIQGWRMQREINAAVAAQHSIEVLPLLDLDAVQNSHAIAEQIAVYLERDFATFGPARVTVASARSPGPDARLARTPGEAPPRAVLAGTTRVVQGTRRITLHLADANHQKPLLHEQIEADEASAGRTAARQIAQRAYKILSQADLSRAEHPTRDPGLLDPETKSFIDQGISLMNRRGDRDLDRALACLKYAIELQPDSSAAHTGLAKALIFQAAYKITREPLGSGLEHARKAVALNPGNQDAHVALAAGLHHAGRIRESIEEAFVSLESGPITSRAANLLVNSYKTLGRPDKALLWLRLAQQRGQLPPAESYEADCLVYLAEDARAEKAYERDRKLHPEQPEGWIGICRLHLLNGRIEQARELYQRERTGYTDFAYALQMAALVEFFGRNVSEAEKLYRELYQRDPNGGGNFHGSVTYSSALGRITLERDRSAALGVLGRAEAEERARLEAGDEDPRTAYRLAAIRATLGDTDSALQYLRQAVDGGLLDYRSLGLDPRFDSIRGSPVYLGLCEELRLRVESMRRSAQLAEGSGKPSGGQ